MNAATTRYMHDEELLEGPMRPGPNRRMDAAPSVSGRPARILIAEDDYEMRSMLAASLRGDGYDVIEAADGAALLEEVSMLLFSGQAVPADLIISDERMPGILGLEILAGLRKSLWPTPFILITGFGDRQTHQKAMALGARAVFDKPFDLDDLKDTIRRILGNE